MPGRRLLVTLIVACAIVAGGESAPGWARGAAAAATPCGLRLQPAQRGELRFATPAGGRAVRHALVGRLVRCTLFRRDGSRFARLHIDADEHVLGRGVLPALRDALERGRQRLRGDVVAGRRR